MYVVEVKDGAARMLCFTYKMAFIPEYTYYYISNTSRLNQQGFQPVLSMHTRMVLVIHVSNISSMYLLVL